VFRSGTGRRDRAVRVRKGWPRSCAGLALGLGLVSALVWGCDDSKKSNPTPGPGPTRGVSFNEAPPESPVPVALGDVPPGIYSIEAAWMSSSSCAREDLVPAEDQRGTHMLVTYGSARELVIVDTRQPLGVWLTSCDGLDACRTLQEQVTLVRTVPTTPSLLMIHQKDATSRLFGQYAHSGFLADGVCERAELRMGSIQPNENGYRLVVQTRKGDIPGQAGRCLWTEAQKQLTKHPCQLSVLDVSFVERGPEVLCLQRMGCRREGKCTERDGLCVAASDEDCRKSSHCKTNGMCSVEDGRCRVLTDADCLYSTYCKQSGYCSAILPTEPKLKDMTCVAKSAEDCRAAEDCKSLGNCAVNKEGMCRPATDADCRASAICKERGWCDKGNPAAADGGSCTGTGR